MSTVFNAAAIKATATMPVSATCVGYEASFGDVRRVTAGRYGLRHRPPEDVSTRALYP